jgi:D-alanyl-D-alanine carboxypeptidase/D-alanyl-D-alanine-endopeptidase (penicillin-binding protein 4)
MMRRLLAVLLTLAAAAACATPAAAYDAADLRSTLAREMRRASPSSSAYVRDLGSGRELFALRAATARIPASVEKLYTTATALLRFGPAMTFDTRAAGDGPVDAAGVLHGDLFLVGAGDPFFGTQTAAQLASAVKAAGITSVDGAVVGDESGFDRLRSGWGTTYDPDLGGVLSALAYNRGFLGGAVQLHAARFAAASFAEQLRAIGVRSSAKARAGAAPAAAGEIARQASPDVRTMIRFVNVPSNNFAAEMLLKALGRRYGAGGSTRAGAAVVRSTWGEIGLRPRVRDGSGLSRANRTTPRDIVDLLARMDDPDAGGDVFRGSLALAGVTGTVKNRMRSTAAFRRCRVKTGTLRRVSALAGYCTTRGERKVAFALLMNRVTSFIGARAIQDRIAAAIARLDRDPPGTSSGGAILP